ncbi:MAG TPA: hypothetical protein VET51_11045 [Burkholderiales bacterium]|nr:hypothetical protein [Burkholderiales bacterium]
MSILPRISLAVLLVFLVACTEEQSRSIGAAPKKTLDRVTTDVNKAMQQGQGSDRLKEDQK